MVQTLENIDKSKVYVDRIEGLDEVVSDVIGDTLIGAVSTITTSDLTANKILISDNNGKVSAGSIGVSDIPNDSNMVHKTGNETLNGIKTFNDAIAAKNGFDVINSSATKGTTPSSTLYWGLFRANDGSNTSTWQAKRLGIGEVSLDTNGNTKLILGVYKNEANSTSSSLLSIIYDKTNSLTYATLSSTPATNDNSTKIATTAFVKAQGYTSNTGTITGITMNGSSKGTSGVVNLGTVATSDTKNTAGSTDTSSKIFLIGATSQAANPQTYSHDTVYVNTSGQLQTPTPDVSSNTTVAATTAYVNNKHQVVSTLPASPDANVFYYIPE